MRRAGDIFNPVATKQVLRYHVNACVRLHSWQRRRLACATCAWGCSTAQMHPVGVGELSLALLKQLQRHMHSKCRKRSLCSRPCAVYKYQAFHLCLICAITTEVYRPAVWQLHLNRTEVSTHISSGISPANHSSGASCTEAGVGHRWC